MSFATDTKNELAHIEPEKDCCKLAEIAGFIRMCGSLELEGFGRFKIVMPTDNPAAARHYKKMIKDYFGVDAPLEVGQSNTLKKGVTYILTIGPEQNSEAILREIGILMIKGGMNYFADGIYDGIVRTKCCRKAYLRGMFMAAGTISNPEKSHHFEISCNSSVLAADVRRLIRTFTDLYPKIVERKKGEGVYVKDGRQILDILAIMGAHSQYLAYDNVMMMKAVKNETNRISNCEIANVDKVVRAAGKQIDAIEKIKRVKGLDFLPDKLQEIALLRLAHPEAPLPEIGEMMDPPIGKSGLSKRFKKIEEIADSLTE